MGVVLSAAGSLRWFRDAIVPEAGVGSDEDPYDRLMGEAAGVAPGADGLFFLPYLAGERTPHMDPHARGAWIGLSLAHERRHLVRALIEGVSFALRDSLAGMERLRTVPELLYVVGGGAKGALWRQILAAALGVPLQRLAAEEGPAMGAALLAAIGAGVHPDIQSAVAKVVRPHGSPELPEPELRAVYGRLHASFNLLYPALKQTGLWTGQP